MEKNRRRYQRIALSLTAQATNSMGSAISIELVELSLQGVALRCDQAGIEHLEELDPKTGRPAFLCRFSSIMNSTIRGVSSVIAVVSGWFTNSDAHRMTIGVVSCCSSFCKEIVKSWLLISISVLPNDLFLIGDT